MVFMLTNRLLIREVLESWQIELTSQVQSVCWDIPRVLAELVESIDSAGRVIAAKVTR